MLWSLRYHIGTGNGRDVEGKEVKIVRVDVVYRQIKSIGIHWSFG